ncbi:NAD(P)-dependent dehydrogenase, short-chain alcohol dehydrogenase family [Nakamurella panacisegetis]|uniref:NAD(P)-dependent dehydrogenase, short-chain alcohol dehydrogenase family n=1 Tax=Nakamurella panacisegetis TaxID=1090615 RepID=A0A1H0QID2_9ACTN|nr:SDR family oxidoreductase [Nakamurella panacisegetis]SDP17141.1 NAD(P)-dependent dehydrogenase, short-chain alcohol dehydrogenase family [Nakamurella panacisegetis]
MPQDVVPPDPAAVPRRLAGRVAVITGASRGIGLAVARRLVAEGARVAITARGADALEEAVAQLGGPEVAVGFAGKADDPEHQQATLRGVAAAFGPVDILINNAGINPAYGPLVDVPLAAARKIMEVNVIGTLAWVQAVCAAGMGERGGAIVNLASVAGVKPAPGIGFYGVSKAAVIHLTAGLAVELGPRIRVNAVAPAVVKTKFAEALYVGREAQVSSQYPLGRLGVPDDVAGAVSFLVSDDASWMTGQTIVLDGGVTLIGGVG